MKRVYIEIRLYQESVKAYVGALGCLFCAGYFRPRLREYLRKYAECVMDFKNDLAVRRYIEMKVEKFPFLMLSGSSIFLYRFTSLPSTMRHTGTASLNFAVILPVFILLSTFLILIFFVLAACLVSDSLRIFGVKASFFSKKFSFF